MRLRPRLTPRTAEVPEPDASSKSCQARYSPELVAQDVGVLVFAKHELEARAAGCREVDEYVRQRAQAGLLAAEGAFVSGGVLYGELIVVAPPDLGLHLPECGDVVDAVLLLQGRHGLVGTADTTLPDLAEQLMLSCVLRPLPDGLQVVQEFALGRTYIYVLFGDDPLLQFVGEGPAELGRPLSRTGEDQTPHPLLEGNLPGCFPQLLVEVVDVGLVLA